MGVPEKEKGQWTGVGSLAPRSVVLRLAAWSPRGDKIPGSFGRNWGLGSTALFRKPKELYKGIPAQGLPGLTRGPNTDAF